MQFPYTTFISAGEKQFRMSLFYTFTHSVCVIMPFWYFLTIFFTLLEAFLDAHEVMFAELAGFLPETECPSMGRRRSN